ncbi:MAG TPA: hypothetical protein VNA17_11250, partial [Pyrinomonadaceae bacterium]|nr:hypothetical protein [Pyrinomonadaceae bacterium]
MKLQTVTSRPLFVTLLGVLLASAVIGQTPTPSPFVMPEGMTGANTNDPRSKLSAGLFDAGETALGIRLVSLLKKPEAFQLGVDPNSPKVEKALTSLGVGNPAQIPAAIKMTFAGLAFANSDLAFQGNHLFLGNFYGMNIYDISDPAKAKLVTSMLCPGGQGDVSVYKNLMFMSVEMPNGRIDCGEHGFPAPPAPPAGQAAPQGPVAEKDRFRGIRIFDISDIRNPKQVAAVQTCRG